MKNFRTIKQPNLRSGFTLVELLVSIGLLVLIMSIFAQIFSLAAGTVLTQRGIAQNDKKARLLFTVISGSEKSPGDFQNMTYRATPAAIPGESGITPMMGETGGEFLKYNGALAQNNQQGYLYISENNPNDQTDDIIQFTVSQPVPDTAGATQQYYYGKTHRWTGTTETDQPEFDDGVFDDETSRSREAEVCYFLRNGILYRRLLLIRKDGEPTDTSVTPNDLLDPANYTGNYYNDFDFSGFYNGSFASINTVTDNTDTANSPLGVPNHRFGFDHVDGIAKEALDVDPIADFQNTYIGRFTHQETSDPNFGYPQRLTQSGSTASPLSQSVSSLTLSNGVVSQFDDGVRQSEDILMTNVLAFDVKVWDSAANGGDGSFVDIGSTDPTNTPVDFTQARRRNIHYGPNGSTRPSGNNVFDTWHKDSTAGREQGGTVGNGYQPPFANPFVSNGTDLTVQTWSQITFTDTDSDGEADITYIVTPPPSFYTSAGTPATLQRAIGFRAVISPGASFPITSSATEPSWGDVLDFTGATVSDLNPQITWEQVINIKPLKAIQLTIVYRDPGTDSVKQVSIVHSFAE